MVVAVCLACVEVGNGKEIKGIGESMALTGAGAAFQEPDGGNCMPALE